MKPRLSETLRRHTSQNNGIRFTPTFKHDILFHSLKIIWNKSHNDESKINAFDPVKLLHSSKVVILYSKGREIPYAECSDSDGVVVLAAWGSGRKRGHLDLQRLQCFFLLFFIILLLLLLLTNNRTRCTPWRWNQWEVDWGLGSTEKGVTDWEKKEIENFLTCKKSLFTFLYKKEIMCNPT